MKTSIKAQQTLEGIIDAVAESYGLARGIDSLESTALPSRRKIVEALGELEHVLFMGFYSTRILSPVNLRHYIAEHLYSATGILVEQIARALAYDRRQGGAPSPMEFDECERLVTRVFKGIPNLRAQLSLDVEAAYDGDPSAKSIEEIIFSYPAIQAIAIYRIAHEFYKRDVPMVPRIMSEHAHSMTGIELHPGATIGKRFFIDHGTGVVVGETAVIGDDVKLYQGVTLGALSMQRDPDGELVRNNRRHPTIEDGVTIYAGATILGGETVIGAGSVIGANTWVTATVPSNTRVSFSAAQHNGNGGQTMHPKT